MNMKVCDVCKKSGKLVESHWRLIKRNGPYEKIGIDLCTEHKNYFQGKTYAETFEFLTGYKMADRMPEVNRG